MPGNPGIGTVATLHAGRPARRRRRWPSWPEARGRPGRRRPGGAAGRRRRRRRARRRASPASGPSRGGRQLEGSQGVRQGRDGRCRGADGAGRASARTPGEVAAALDEFGPPYVVKDDGLAAGKGVVVTDDRDERPHARRMPCDRVVIEEYLDGPEVSLFAVCRRHDRLPAAAGTGLQADRATATRAPTPAAWAPTRRSPGRPPDLVDEVLRDACCSRRVDELAGAVRRSPGCCTPAWR